MGYANRPLHLDEAFSRIEDSILPSISMMLDMMLDATALSRPGVDAAVHAAELRIIALELESLARQIEAMSPCITETDDYPEAARA